MLPGLCFLEMLLVFPKFIGLNWKQFFTTSLTHVDNILFQLHERKSKTLQSQTKDQISTFLYLFLTQRESFE